MKSWIAWMLVVAMALIAGPGASGAEAAAPADAAATEPVKEAPKLVLDLVVKYAEVNLGDPIDFTVRVLNAGGAEQTIKALEFHYGSVYLKAKYNGQEFELGHFASSGKPGEDFQRRYQFDEFPLAAGASARVNFSLPAVAVGEFEFTAWYNCGGEVGNLSSAEPVKVKVNEFQGNNQLLLRLETSKGPIVFQTYPGDALNTVTHMTQLIQSKFFDGLTFHRIIPGQVIQGGDPKGAGTGGPGYQLKAEFSDRVKHEPGAISMARSQSVDSAGSQFFICSVDVPGWDDKENRQARYTVWGKAVEGLDLIKQLTDIPVKGDTEAFKQAKRDIREKYKDLPTEQKRTRVQADTAELEKTREQPSEPVTILSFKTEFRHVEAAAETPKEDTKPEETK